MVDAHRAALLAILVLATLPAVYAISRAIAYAWRDRYRRRAVRAGKAKRERERDQRQ